MSEDNYGSGNYTAAVQDSCYLIVPCEQMQMQFPLSGTVRRQKDVKSEVSFHKLNHFNLNPLN